MNDMEEIVKHINDTNASYRTPNAGDAKNTDLFLDNEHYELFEGSGEQITVRFSKENLAKAIMFIASILPRKYDNSSDHKTVMFSEKFIYEQLELLDGYFSENGVPVKYKTQVWNARKNVVKKNGEIDNRFYFNGLLETFTYNDQNGNLVKAKFSIRNYMAGGYSDIHIRKAEDGIFDVWVTNTTECRKGNSSVDNFSWDTWKPVLPLQQITYGAPGTGKSYGIDEDLKMYHMAAIRTTFHPDSDYSTFVGAYKPQMESVGAVKKQTILDYSTLVDKFKEYLDAKPSNITKACTLFGFDYHDSIVNMQNYGKTIVDLVSDAYKSGTTYDSQVRAGMSVYEQNTPAETREKKIVYKYSKQAFLKAYIAAWKDLKNPYVLVIEEINRGNCAQIFGDLFQLLDRNDKGFSSYPITPDADIMQTLSEAFEGLDIQESEAIDGLYTEDVMSDVMAGNRMLLSNNLYIWATMNTSDQSLFPIDSAFKRRWEWKYVPISDAGKRWSVLINGVRYDWWSFLDSINKKIWDATHSEDKKLGYFFCKANPDDGIIYADKFVGKVLFYIYNDVFKDYGFDDAIFRDEKDKENPELLFKDYFLPNGKPREEKIQVFMKNLKVKTEAEVASQSPVPYIDEEVISDDQKADSVNEPQNQIIEPRKFVFNGVDGLSEADLAVKIIERYLEENTGMTFIQLKSVLTDDLMGDPYSLYGVLASSKDLKSATYEEQKKIYKIFDKTAKHTSSDGVEFFVNSNWNTINIHSIIDFAKEQGWSVSTEN